MVASMVAPADLAAPSVLLVDDEAAVHEVLERVFESMGYRLESVFSAEEGLARLATKPYDVFLIDKNLPGQSGVSLARAARASQPGTTIIVVTGYASRASADELVGVADEYLTKPFDLETVRQTVAALLARRRTGRPSPPPTRAEREAGKKWVHVLTDREAENELLLSVCEKLGVASTFGVLTPNDPPDLLVLAADLASLELRKVVWALQGKSRTFQVVLVVDPRSNAHAAAAVAAQAAHRLSRPLDAHTASLVLQRALEG